MSTLKQLTYSVRESLQQYSTTSDITNEFIEFLILNSRNLLIAQKFSNRGNLIPNKLRQHFYLDLELADENEFVSGLDTVVRTTTKIQYPLEAFNFRNNLRLTSGSYSDINFSFVIPERFPYVGYSKWNNNQIYYTIGSDWKLYLTSNNPKVKLIERVKLSMVCENPSDAYASSVDYNSSIDYNDTEFHLEGEMDSLVTDMVIKKLTQMLSMPEDKTNDAQDDITTQNVQ